MVIKTFQAGFLAYISGSVKSIVTYCFEQGRSTSQITDLVLGILLFIFLCGICVGLHLFIMKNEALIMCKDEFYNKYSALYSGLDVWRLEARF